MNFGLKRSVTDRGTILKAILAQMEKDRFPMKSDSPYRRAMADDRKLCEKMRTDLTNYFRTIGVTPDNPQGAARIENACALSMVYLGLGAAYQEAKSVYSSSFYDQLKSKKPVFTDFDETVLEELGVVFQSPGETKMRQRIMLALQVAAGYANACPSAEQISEVYRALYQFGILFYPYAGNYRPVKCKPAESKPAERKPAQSKPTEPKPAQRKNRVYTFDQFEAVLNRYEGKMGIANMKTDEANRTVKLDCLLKSRADADSMYYELEGIDNIGVYEGSNRSTNTYVVTCEFVFP